MDKIIEQINDDIMVLETVLSCITEVKNFNDVAWLQHSAGRLQSSLNILKKFDEITYIELYNKTQWMRDKATQLVYGKKKN